MNAFAPYADEEKVSVVPVPLAVTPVASVNKLIASTTLSKVVPAWKLNTSAPVTPESSNTTSSDKPPGLPGGPFVTTAAMAVGEMPSESPLTIPVPVVAAAVNSSRASIAVAIWAYVRVPLMRTSTSSVVLLYDATAVLAVSVVS